MKHDKKKQWLSIGLLTLGAAALAIFAAATLDAGDVRASLEALMPGWTAAIVGCMLLYYLCDALKYRLYSRQSWSNTTGSLPSLMSWVTASTCR